MEALSEGEGYAALAVEASVGLVVSHLLLFYYIVGAATSISIVEVDVLSGVEVQVLSSAPSHHMLFCGFVIVGFPCFFLYFCGCFLLFLIKLGQNWVKSTVKCYIAFSELYR